MPTQRIIDLRSHADLRCLVCHQEGTWQLMRCGDARRAWSCDDHLARVMTALQHERGLTRLTVYSSGRASVEVSQAL